MFQLFNRQKKIKKKTKSKISFYEEIEMKLKKQTKKQSVDLLKHMIKPLTYQVKLLFIQILKVFQGQVEAEARSTKLSTPHIKCRSPRFYVKYAYLLKS